MRNFRKFLNEEKGAPKELDMILTMLEDARRLSQSRSPAVRSQLALARRRLGRLDLRLRM